MRKIILSVFTLLAMFSIFFTNVPKTFASKVTYIKLSDENITVNNSSITQDTTQDIYLSKAMNNGGNSADAVKANKDIANVINIISSGTYEFTGDLTDGQIAVNSNNIKGDVVIVLSNANITCENAPAIFIYNKKSQSSTCNVIIKTAQNSKNIISGGKIKQSVEGWADQSELLYYVEKDYNDKGEYFERYKYDGAISSDITLTFEGEGNLTINSISKEGIETKRDIIINSGNYVINSLDDGMNAAMDGESIITINDGNILVNVMGEADEGDAIDSNGYLYINGGTVYAFASEKSEDSGLDSDLGTYINGGTVVAIGNMADTISKDSKQNFLQLEFRDKVSKDTLITITDKNKNAVVALKNDREYFVLVISTPKLADGEFYVYENGEIDGTNQNGLYTQINSYTPGMEKEYTKTSDIKREGRLEKNFGSMKNQNNKVYIYTIVALTVALIILIVIAILLKKKGKIVTLFIGILLGAILATIGFMMYTNVTRQESMLSEPFQQNEMPERPEGPKNVMPKL